MKKTSYVAKAGIIASLYVVLTWVSSVFGLSSGVIQCRLGEALCILPIFTPAAIPGVTIGCVISNILFSGSIFDITLGSLATLAGAFGAYLLRKGKLKYLASFPTVIANAVTVPVILILMGIDELYWYIALTVAIGEVLSCTLIGGILARYIEKSGLKKFLA